MFTRDDHEALLDELNNPELEHSRRSEILQSLRTDYGSVLSTHEESTQKLSKLEAENSDLVHANSKLFRQLGIQGDPDAKKKEKQKSFSETVTLESIEKGVR